MSAKIGQPVGANAVRARSHNRQILLRHVRDTGPMGRAEIARATGLSTQAVSNIIAQLLDDGLLSEDGAAPRGRGLPVMRYALNPEGGFALGFEIRPDALFATLLDFCGREVFSKRQGLAGSQPDQVRDPLASLKADALASSVNAGNRLLGSGIVLPGPFGKTGILGNASELEGWEDIEADAWLCEILDMPVSVAKDANAAAMAERFTGVAGDLGSFVYLYFGAGLGLAIVQDGQLVTGAWGNAGEIGHVPVAAGGRTDDLENFVSRLSVQRCLGSEGLRAETSEDIESLFAARDPVLAGWLATASEALSSALGIIENLFDPEAVILGGAMPAPILDQMIEGTVLPVRSVANRTGRARPRLIRGTTGRLTATHGAAALVLDHAFTPKIAIASQEAHA